MSYSPELSPIDYSEDEKEPVAPPTIKLKLKLNPYPAAAVAAAAEDKKKKKHKKKHKKHKKSKRSDREEEEEEPVYHRHVGGKRPFAMLQQQNQQQPQQPESDNESYHPTDTKKTKYEPTIYEYDQQPLESTSQQQQQQNTQQQRASIKQERRTSSMKSTSTNGEKPKKRGRPTNKAKAAAIIAQLPPKVPETPKKDMKSIFLKLLDTVQKKDAYGFFLEPVNPKLVPDYLKIIKNPMDFSTMRKKVMEGSYTTVDLFRSDFNLITTNAKIYNSAETIYWKCAERIREAGTKLIDRAEKQIEEEKLAVVQEEEKKESFSARKLSMSFANRKESFGIKEEEVDIMGIDNNAPSLRKQSRQGSEMNIREASMDLAHSRALTPIRSITNTPYKKKKKKVAESGVLYAPDGSLNIVGGVHDLLTLLPTDPSFAQPPQLTTSNPSALPSAFFSNRHSADDFFHNKHLVHSAHFCDYGPFTTLGGQPPGAFYTTQDASYIYPLYGDDRGEAYMKSLWEFLDQDENDTMLVDKIDQTSNYLTRGAWQVVKQVLQRKDDHIDGETARTYESVKTEFGLVNVADIVDKIEQKKLNDATEPAGTQ
ncbi:hypothetical protein HPULCUR_007007 [Helicostylum pulchrum]|uniref:Bromo domain-containing protein n=1 Tax=Helicostylum pulchrum TaxID=562976 RepID=A0ABP9Y3H5_9FUNG